MTDRRGGTPQRPRGAPRGVWPLDFFPRRSIATTGRPYIPPGMLHSVAETPTVLRDAAAVGIAEAEKAELITFLAPPLPRMTCAYSR